ncbi:MAG: response regulator, partial [Dehalococcoidia bacterium]|nr:response regulator [Dehalococcoidia bacterium]
FFQSLAAFLAEKLEMFYVCLDRLEGDGLMARTVTVYCDGHFEDNVTYALEDTPSGDVVGKSVCCFPASVCQFFPRDQVLQDLRAESYIGVTLWGYTGEPIGLIAVIGRQPLANRLQAEQILKTVAVRAGAELERLEAEKALMASEERFRTMFEEAPLGIALIDSSSGQIQEMNRMFAKIGAGTEDLDASKDRISLSLFEEVGGEAGGQPLANAGRTAGLQKEKRFTRADGTAVWVRMTTAPLQIDDGGVGRSLYMIEDITDRRLLEEQISRSKRLEVAGQIAGQVAHDFNKLLTPMTAYPELIRMELPASHAVLRYLDLIENSALQMAAINEDLLTLSRRGHFNQEPLALNNLVKQALAQMHEPPNTLIVDLDLAPDLLPVKGSAAQLLRVIANLVTNARDAMIDMGELMVKTGNVYLDKDQLGFGRITVGEYVRLQVQDTGCGMSPETIQRIFEPFYTTKVTDRRRGTGLGLSVVQSIVEDHGGLVDVVSRLGIGSTFSLYFPICREAVKVVPGVEVQRGGETILVVDDDALQLEVDRTLLTGLGYTVNAVASGEKAVAYLRDQPVDLVLLDMIMPGGMDGLETYEAIRKLRPAQRVIIVSGYAESDRVKAVQALGAGAFLPKPINLQKLAKAVRDELDGR